MFGINQIFRAKAGFPAQSGPDSSGIDGQHPPYRVFPQGKDMFPVKSEVIGVFLPEETPLAVLLYAIGGGY
jgi:hypothetical protein